MRAKKTYLGPPHLAVTSIPPTEIESPIIHIGENPSSWRTIDLTSWLGKGIDEWVWMCAAQLRVLIANRSNAPATIVFLGGGSLNRFFKFLTTKKMSCTPVQFESRHIEQYVDWLKKQPQWNKSTQKGAYSGIKSLLVGLQQRGVVSADRLVFPRNPFPGSNTNLEGETPLSLSERTRFASALRDDIVAIHKGTFIGNESEALTVHAFALALRTGLNPTPLLELRRDCLRPHPFMPTMMSLESFKRRGNATHVTGLRFSSSDEQAVSIPMDGVALLRMILAKTEPLVGEAPEHLRERIWLYRKQSRFMQEPVAAMSGQTLFQTTQLFINRHELKADDGTRLRINPSRLRKTLENRLWQISDGDLFTVAEIMGHTPRVADNHYLSCTNEMREDATFVGEALPEIFRGNPVDGYVQKLKPLEITPVGSCKDSLFGDKAPMDGKNHCSDFLSCFSCRSYAVVGAPADLHRLFSFYWFLHVERDRVQSKEWASQFTTTINLIDSFTREKFDIDLINRAKKKAKAKPTTFWAGHVRNLESKNGTA